MPHCKALIIIPRAGVNPNNGKTVLEFAWPVAMK